MTADNLVLAVRRYLDGADEGMNDCPNSEGPADRCYLLLSEYCGELCDRCNLRKVVDEYEQKEGKTT